MSSSYNGAVHTGNAENFSRGWQTRHALSLSAWRLESVSPSRFIHTVHFWSGCGLCSFMVLGDGEQKCQMSHRLNWRSDKRKKNTLRSRPSQIRVAHFVSPERSFVFLNRRWKYPLVRRRWTPLGLWQLWNRGDIFICAGINLRYKVHSSRSTAVQEQRASK